MTDEIGTTCKECKYYDDGFCLSHMEHVADHDISCDRFRERRSGWK